MKKCNKCKIEKELECFYKASRGDIHHICKTCYLEKAKEKAKENAKEKPNRELVLQSKRNNILLLSRQLGRYPKVAEIIYFEKTGKAKKTKHFTPEETSIYNPGFATLQKTHKRLIQIMYIWANFDKIKARLERERRKEERNARIEAKEKEAHKRWEAMRIRSLMQSKAYVSTRGTPANERALRKQTAIDNKRRVQDILKFHEMNDVAIPDVMRDVIIKYR